MKKSKKCPICSGKAKSKSQDYRSGKRDSTTGEEIIVSGVETVHCQNEECGHSWLPIEQERIIDREIASRSRFDLIPDQITTIRESLPFTSKFQTADFLCLNEKAFTKWELGYSEPNRAYDLLLRLSVHSWDNYNFIQHLHKSNFAFDMRDYQILCDKYNMKWNFEMLSTSSLTMEKSRATSLVESETDAEEEFVETSESATRQIASDEENLAA